MANFKNETYLYFAENLAADAAGDCVVYPASSFLGADPIGATSTRLSFKALDGEAHDDDILVTHVADKYVELVEALTTCMNSDGPECIVFMDEDASIYHKTLYDGGVIDGSTALNITLA
jgi:hypothetical protein